MPNVFALLANSPGALACVTPVGAHVRYGTSFDDALREYVILTVAQELRCTYDPESRGGDSPDGRKVRGTIHWVSAAHALPAEVRLYDHLYPRAVANFVCATVPPKLWIPLHALGDHPLCS